MQLRARSLGERPAVIVSRNAAGWHRLLVQLEAYLDDRDSDWSPAQQTALQQRYLARLEPLDLCSE